MGSVTPSEEFTEQLCTKTFLSPWCYGNPRGKKGKELCDVLVACEPDIVVFSVKEIELGNPDDATARERWQRRAVEESCDQLYGATKWLKQATHIIRSDGTTGIKLPLLPERRIHRIAVAFGSRGECLITSGDFGRGHVHVFTEFSLVEVLRELDTVTDFVAYLRAKEEFLTNKGSIIINGTEMDLLGMYLKLDRQFPDKADFLMIEDGIWDGVKAERQFVGKKREDQISYSWDELIESLAKSKPFPLGCEENLDDQELIIRCMAREDRYCRRSLATKLVEFLQDAKNGKTRSRAIKSSSRTLYVFASFKKGESHDSRVAELYARCLIARAKVEEASDAVVGIGFNEYVPGVGSITDLLYVQINPSDYAWVAEAKELEETFGYFSNRPIEKFNVEEYPSFRNAEENA